jgi:hypothetical protein
MSHTRWGGIFEILGQVVARFKKLIEGLVFVRPNVEIDHPDDKAGR